jgi:nicotinate-nucleotide adenylyltransferase
MPDPMMRIGLYGGSFDPVHLGHILVARAAIEELELDRLCFIPAAQSPFKPAAAPQSASDRLRWLRLALAGEPRFLVDDQELQRGGISYTIDTVKSYQRQYPGAQLFYLIGADHVRLLPQWRSASELAQLLEFVVLPRPGEPCAPLPAPFRGRFLQGFPISVSSSQIRDRIRKGLAVDHLLPFLVAEALRNNNLYHQT